MKDNPEFGERRHVRVGYGGGSVTLRCHRSEPFVPGTLLDLSIGGCGIAMEAPLGLTTEQVVELRITLNGMAFRVLAFVRRIHPKTHEIGLEFHQLSETDRAELEEFLLFFAPV
jgi:c-di-GMP-binding flagellar brake protein YcgR